MSNEIILSTDINIITAEINSYKQVAGQAIFEIGIRIKKVHDEKLAEVRGGWTNWLREIEMSTSQADRFMKIVKEIGYKELPHVGNISFRALYEIATLPPDERDQPHTIPSTGETKTVDEMTVRELREVKAALKKAEQELAQERKAKEALIDTVESMGEQKVREVIKEVTPESVKNEIEELRSKIKVKDEKTRNIEIKLLQLNEENSEYQKKIRDIENYQKSEQYEIERLRREKEKLEIKAHISINELQIKIHKFIEDAAPSVFLQGAVASSTFMMRDDLLDSIISLEEFTSKLREMLYSKVEVNNKKNIIEIN